MCPDSNLSKLFTSIYFQNSPLTTRVNDLSFNSFLVHFIIYSHKIPELIKLQTHTENILL